MVQKEPSGQLERIKEIRNGVYKLEAVTAIQKPVRHHQSDRFFAQCHIAASLFSYTAFLPPFRMTPDSKASSEANVKDLLPMVRKTIRRHSGQRIYDCGEEASKLSLK